MKKTLLFLLALVGMSCITQAQVTTKDLVGTWESSETVFSRFYNMNISYSKTRMVITADRFTYTEWVHGSRELPGVGLNFEMNLRDEMILGYRLDGMEMLVTKYYQNPKIKIEKYSLGGDKNTLDALKKAGVTADTYRPSMEQSMNSNSNLFEMVGFLIKRYTPTEIELAYDGGISLTLHKVANTQKAQTSAKKDEKTAQKAEAKAEKEAVKEEKADEKEAEKAEKTDVSDVDNQPVDQPNDSIAEVKENISLGSQKSAEVKETQPVVKEEKAEEPKEEKSWYTEAWETFLSWF